MLIVAVGRRMYAIPLERIEETMRPLPIEPLAGTRAFVRGVSVIRGSATPVVDLGGLVGTPSEAEAWQRFVTLRVGERRVALGVDRVVGVRTIPAEQVQALPPLLRDAGDDVIGAVGADHELVLVLGTARLVPDDVWAELAESQ